MTTVLEDFAGHHITHSPRVFLLTLLKRLIEEYGTGDQNNETLHRHVDDTLQRESIGQALFTFTPQIDEPTLEQRFTELTSGSPIEITRHALFLYQQLGGQGILQIQGVSEFLLQQVCPIKFSLPLGNGVLRTQDSQLVFISPLHAPCCDIWLRGVSYSQSDTRSDIGNQYENFFLGIRDTGEREIVFY